MQYKLSCLIQQYYVFIKAYTYPIVHSKRDIGKTIKITDFIYDKFSDEKTILHSISNIKKIKIRYGNLICFSEEVVE